jgi:putative transposase
MDGYSGSPDCAAITMAKRLRLIGSIRRECLDHVLAFREAGLRQTLKQYFAYYERYRTHLSLKKDAPVGRPVEPPSFGEVIQIPQVGGLHHLALARVP